MPAQRLGQPAGGSRSTASTIVRARLAGSCSRNPWRGRRKTHRPCTQLHQRLAAPISGATRCHLHPLPARRWLPTFRRIRKQQAAVRERPVLGRTNQQMHLRGRRANTAKMSLSRSPTTIISRAPAILRQRSQHPSASRCEVLPRQHALPASRSQSPRLPPGSRSPHPPDQSTASASASTAHHGVDEEAKGEDLCRPPRRPQSPRQPGPEKSPRSRRPRAAATPAAL